MYVKYPTYDVKIIKKTDVGNIKTAGNEYLSIQYTNIR